MANKLSNKVQSTWEIFFWPLVLNIIGLLGLIAALLGDGWLDLLSWLCLGAAVVLILYSYYKNEGVL